MTNLPCRWLAAGLAGVVACAACPAGAGEGPSAADQATRGASAGEQRVSEQLPSARNPSAQLPLAQLVSDKLGDKKAGDGKPPKPPSKVEKATPAMMLTPAREAAVMAFVEQHHPELSGLLSYLKANHDKEYQRAARDLFRVSERLAHAQERDAELYQLELNLWKSQSRLQLLAARLKMSDTPELRQQIRALLADQLEIRKKLIGREHAKAAERAEKLAAQLRHFETRRDDWIEAQMRALTLPAAEPSAPRVRSEQPVSLPK